MNLSEIYRALGGDLKEVTERLGDEMTVELFLLRFPDDDSFSTLIYELENNNLQKAFRASHTLKGVSQCLGLKRLSNYITEICEILRVGNMVPSSLLENLKQEYNTVILAISNYTPTK